MLISLAESVQMAVSGIGSIGDSHSNFASGSDSVNVTMAVSLTVTVIATVAKAMALTQ